MGRIVYLNGEFLPEEQARVSVLDRGFLYGDGLFETMRAYSGRVFRLQGHYQRLAGSAEQIGLGLPLSADDAARIIAELLRRNGLHDAYVRLTVSRGEGLGVEPPASAAPTVSVVVRELTLPDQRLYEDGANIVLLGPSGGPPVQAIRQLADRPQGGPEGPPLAGLKSLSYLDRLLARRAAREAGADDAVLTNSTGHLTEASTSNVFFVRDGALCTPSVDCGLLPGITRQAVLEAAAGAGMTIKQGRFVPQDLLAAEECFLTNSIAEILPVTRVETARIGSGRAGAVTAKLTAAYRRLVASELGLARQ